MALAEEQCPVRGAEIEAENGAFERRKMALSERFSVLYGEGDLHILAPLSSAGIAQLVERRIRNA